MRLASREDLTEKIDAFVGGFGHRKDSMGDKLIPGFSQLMGEHPKPQLGALACEEEKQWLDKADVFIVTSKVCNQLVHEYMAATALFPDALLTANGPPHADGNRIACAESDPMASIAR